MRLADKRFLVVLPVRNGGDYVRECLASILAQTYPHFRVAVLDNASDDGTADYVRSLADPRISLQESSVALSIEDNWRRVAQLDGDEEFLTLIGHDDLLDPPFLERMSALIDAHPDARLYHAGFRLIDACGRRIRASAPGGVRETAAEFLAARLRFVRDSYGTGYVCRLADYRRVGGIPAWPKLMFADDALWLSLMRGSYKASEQRESFAYRLHRASTSGSPPWAPTFAALGAYLDCLAGMAAADAVMSEVLRTGLAGYLRYWFRWAWFSAGVATAERAELRHQAELLAMRAGGLFGSGIEADLRATMRRDLQGGWPRASWFLWRVRMHLWRRLTG